MIGWFRRVLPSLGLLIGFFLVYSCFSASVVYWEWRVGRPLPELRVRATFPVLVFGIVGYAVQRVLCYHPICRPRYQAWLSATPWTIRKALPLGPIHLAPQDFVLLGLVMVTAWPTSEPWTWYVPQIFLCTYLLFLGLTLFLTGEWLLGYAVGLGLGLAIRLWPFGPGCLLVALLTYGVAYLGLRRALARFPWHADWLNELHALSPTNAQDLRSQKQVGWPFGRLGPRFPGPEVRVPMHHAVLASLLAGWWVYDGCSLISEREPRLGALGFALFAGLLGAVCRWALYVEGYKPPITLLGRMATGRLLIHGYDQVVVAPFLAVFMAVALPAALTWLGLDPVISIPSSLTLMLMITLGMGPSLKQWRLTGNHRIVEGNQLRQGSIRVG